MLRSSRFSLHTRTKKLGVESTDRLLERLQRKAQATNVPQKLGISFGSESRPIAFLPRQPIEEDGAVFPEGPAKTIYDSPVVDFDEKFLREASSSFVDRSDLEKKQIPIAQLQSPRLGIPPSLLKKMQSPPFEIQNLTPVQAKMLQRTFLLHDCAISAETGSGKTLGLCIALIAKLLRQGPNRRLSALFLVPSDVLVHQVATWLTELWPYEKDKEDLTKVHDRVTHENFFKSSSANNSGSSFRPLISNSLVSTIYSTEKPYIAYKRVIVNKKRIDSKIIVSTPEVFWKIFKIRSNKQEGYLRKAEEEKQNAVYDILTGGGNNALANYLHLGYVKKSLPKYHLKSVIPSLDTIVVDEADEILPTKDLSAPGNLLLQELTNPVRFKSPLQLLLNSATLSPSTISHLRRYLRKNVFAASTSRIFESDSAEQKEYLKKEREARKKREGFMSSSYGGDNDNSESARAAAVNPTLQLSETISHRFLAADTNVELKESLKKVMADFVDEYRFDEVEIEEKNTNPILEQENKTMIEMKKRRENSRETMQMKPTVESSTKAIQAEDDDGYSNFDFVHHENTTTTASSTGVTTTTSNSEETKETEKIVDKVEQKQDDKTTSTSSEIELSRILKQQEKQRPKILIVYPQRLTMTPLNKETSEDENEEDEENEEEIGEFFKQHQGDIKVSGSLTSLSNLEEIVDEAEQEVLMQLKKMENDNDEKQECNHHHHQKQLPIIALSAEQVRGFDDPNVRKVVILARPESIKEFVHWSGRVGRMGKAGEAVFIASRTWMKDIAVYCDRLGVNFKVEKI